MLLTAELRNRIYHFAKEENAITYFPRRLRNHSDEELKLCPVKKTPSSFIGLTQACRQLRQEYSPIYATGTSIHVGNSDAEEYFNVNLPLLARDVDGKIIGKLFLDGRSVAVDGGLVPDEELNIEIAPLLALCRNNLGLQVRGGISDCDCMVCALAWSDMEDDLRQLFNLVQKSPLGQSLVDNFVSVNLTATRFVIKMKQGDLEECVTVRRDENDEERFTLAKTGFEFSRMTKIYEVSLNNTK